MLPHAAFKNLAFSSVPHLQLVPTDFRQLKKSPFGLASVWRQAAAGLNRPSLVILHPPHISSPGSLQFLLLFLPIPRPLLSFSPSFFSSLFLLLPPFCFLSSSPFLLFLFCVGSGIWGLSMLPHILYHGARCTAAVFTVEKELEGFFTSEIH